MKKILILDGYNTFVRNYVVNPSLDPRGNPIGGTFGFLKSLQKLVRETQPSKIIVAWDGQGGSAKRKKMVKEYKDGRKPLQLNRNVDQDLTPDQEAENRRDQFLRLVEYLNDMPVAQLILDDVEADDIIAYICQLESLKEYIKVIVSSDKDFFQLCNDEVMVLRPIQNEVLNELRIVEQFDIHPNNFALARALVGDKSDNLPGIKGAGMKTVAKRFPQLRDSKSMTLKELFAHCKENEETLKLYRDILDDKDTVKLNYKMMQLYSPSISAQGTRYVRDIVDNFIPTFNRTETEKRMIYDNFVGYNWNSLFQNFGAIVRSSRN